MNEKKMSANIDFYVLKLPKSKLIKGLFKC